MKAVKTKLLSVKKQSDKKKGRPTSVDEYVGQRLRQRRTILGFSQEKLAELVGITFQQIQKYENGANRVSASRLYQFSDVLDVTTDFFFDGLLTPKAKIMRGLSDNDQEPFDNVPGDVMKDKETLELIRVYYSVKNPKVRKDFLKLLKTMASDKSSSEE